MRRSNAQELVLVASRQHGVVSLAQLAALRLSASGISRRVADGRLHRIHAGVYAVGRPDLPIEGHWMAATLACGADALLSHRSAAGLHELLDSAATRIDVTISGPSPRAHSSIRVHRSETLTMADRTIVNGIPCTSVARTLLDLAAVVRRSQLDRACNQAEILRVFDRTAIEELLARSGGRRGIRNLRAVLGAGDLGENIARSELERRFLALCRGARLPLPSVNDWVRVGGDYIEVDFVWRGERLAVEVDGYRTHRTRYAFERDRRRDQLLAAAGWRHARFTWDEVSYERGHVERILSRLIERRISPA